MTKDATTAFQELMLALGDSGTDACLDAPSNPKGEHWIDVTVDGHRTEVAYREEHGFGLYHPGNDCFGVNPDEVVRDPVEAARRLREVVLMPPQVEGPGGG